MIGPDVLCGMAGYLVSAVLMGGTLGQLLLGRLACCELERSLGAYPVDESAFWSPAPITGTLRCAQYLDRR